jgi:hypothetical protein
VQQFLDFLLIHTFLISRRQISHGYVAVQEQLPVPLCAEHVVDVLGPEVVAAHLLVVLVKYALVELESRLVAFEPAARDPVL